jgi:D-beta-D-heptose 7-phosphate kinase/D-beta-D-heptose 1-phosphate adenosyltransferase
LKPRDPLSKVKNRSALKKIAAKKKKIVFTNGVFDILHRGHVTYLNQARKQGDLLVVALNDDASVKRLKGDSRPIHTLSDRILTIAALECVDYVTWFSEDTPLETILELKPSIIVKGGDYSPSAPPSSKKYIVGTLECKKWGGKSKVLPFVDGYSTTKILSRSR